MSLDYYYTAHLNAKRCDICTKKRFVAEELVKNGQCEKSCENHKGQPKMAVMV